MFGQDRQQLRQFFHNVWAKMQTGETLSPLEMVVAEVIKKHPEYHAIFNKPEQVDRDYFVEAGETNPYLHMALHISLHEQIITDRPAGIRTLYQQLVAKTGDAHKCEHLMMECLAESLWQAQRDQQPPSDEFYLAALQKLLQSR
ncbi:DUF1841 family protein [Methylophaga sp. OBS4]|uniref:DUF1841 family protein n=1 Tax=Methylophaga sp. OBS4 TaxID=2991935 RepID=UPI00225BCCC5|nr:DUF1841 family protein [Methylophaga sp. OBS4]MCX4186690.1 DUF1841 family protein [Methylophaga sp. OBS4]